MALNAVKAAQRKVAETFLHKIRLGDYVVTRDLRRKTWRAKRWRGPYQVLLTTHTAVKVGERATWVHANHCRRVPPISEGQQVEEPQPQQQVQQQTPRSSPNTWGLMYQHCLRRADLESPRSYVITRKADLLSLLCPCQQPND
ncbi:hypothetical protein F2P79_006912 [Pimephales promelas]|nr:hypothetical protein F2P79_006912 [Pimephales promelas]